MADCNFNNYILFPNHHEGLRAHKKCRENGVKCTIAPTPREASTSCGISLLLSDNNIDSALKIIAENNIRTEGTARIERKKNLGYKSC